MSLAAAALNKANTVAAELTALRTSLGVPEYNNPLTVESVDNVLVTALYGFDTSTLIGDEITIDFQGIVAKEGIAEDNWDRLSVFVWDSTGTKEDYNPAGSVFINAPEGEGTTVTSVDFGTRNKTINRTYTYTVTNSKLFIIFGLYGLASILGSRMSSALTLNINGTEAEVTDIGHGKIYGQNDTLEWQIVNTQEDISNNQWSGKTMNIIGDSITAGLLLTDPVNSNYAQLVANTLNMTCNNYGISSSQIAVYETTPETRDPMVVRYVNMSDDADLIIVAGGTNDFQYALCPFGDFSSRSSYDFYGAMHNLCVGLIEKYPGKNILFMTPIHRSQDLIVEPENTNANGKTLLDYCNAIKQVCARYGIPVLDMYSECTLNPHIESQKTTYVPDGTHPNEDGHIIMSKRLTGYLRSLI
jgi:lysophospholipase L1-like esterase